MMSQAKPNPYEEIQKLLRLVAEQHERNRFLEAEVERLRKIIRDIEARERNQDRKNGHV